MEPEAVDTLSVSFGTSEIISGLLVLLMAFLGFFIRNWYDRLQKDIETNSNKIVGLTDKNVEQDLELEKIKANNGFIINSIKDIKETLRTMQDSISEIGQQIAALTGNKGNQSKN